MSEQRKKPMKLLLVSGVEGPSVYLNDYRIAGPKPWGGGTIQREWNVERENVERALENGAQ